MRAHPTAIVLVLLLVSAGLVAAAAWAVGTPSRPARASSVDPVALPTLERQGLVLPMGNATEPDAEQVGYPSVLFDEGLYKMWYFEVQPYPWLAQIAYATSADGVHWTKQATVLSPTWPNETNDVAYPTVALVNGTYWMWYNGYSGYEFLIFAATSPDGVTWTKRGAVLDVGPAGSQDSASVVYPFVLYDNGTFDMWYTGLTSFTPPDNAAVMFATSTDGLHWTKHGTVLAPGPQGSLDCDNLFTAGVVRVHSTYVMVYMGQDANAMGRLLWAESADGIHWQRLGAALGPNPPSENSVGQADPVVLPNGTWRVYYAVRNYTADIQIYLAEGSPGNGTSPPEPSPPEPSPPSPSPPDPMLPVPPPSGEAGPGSSGALLLPLTGWAPPAVVIATYSALGAAIGGGLAAAIPRLRRRGSA